MVADSTDISSETSGFKANYLVQAWLVLLLSICFGSALAAVQLTLGPTIEANKINETREKVPELVWGREAAEKLLVENAPITVVPHQVAVETAIKKTSYPVFEASMAGERAGWVIKSTGQGYADKIELLIGVDARAEKITGLFVLNQKETPGLGNKIIDPPWRAQFFGKKTGDPLRVIKGGTPKADTVDAVTGATISSQAVCRIVNTALGDLREKLSSKPESTVDSRQSAVAD